MSEIILGLGPKNHQWLIDKIKENLGHAAEYAAFHGQWEDGFDEHIEILEKAILHARIMLRHIEEKKPFNAVLSNKELK